MKQKTRDTQDHHWYTCTVEPLLSAPWLIRTLEQVLQYINSTIIPRPPLHGPGMRLVTAHECTVWLTHHYRLDDFDCSIHCTTDTSAEFMSENCMAKSVCATQVTVRYNLNHIQMYSSCCLFCAITTQGWCLFKEASISLVIMTSTQRHEFILELIYFRTTDFKVYVQHSSNSARSSEQQDMLALW